MREEGDEEGLDERERVWKTPTGGGGGEQRDRDTQIFFDGKSTNGPMHCLIQFRRGWRSIIPYPRYHFFTLLAHLIAWVL